MVSARELLVGATVITPLSDGRAVEAGEGMLADIGAEEVVLRLDVEIADCEVRFRPSDVLIASVVPTVTVTLIVGVDRLPWLEFAETLRAGDE